ncbi:MAG: hypothetical protein L6R39_001541 [Caloplaca ligustica]|nr:MAG: hypothetical protein L6R39_001541 [Caloplaca ligustica]
MVLAYPPLDFIDQPPYVRDLTLSGLPTPRTDVIDGKLSPPDVQDEKTLEAESPRMIQAMKDRAPPSVIKFPQSLAGQGVFLIRDDATKTERIHLKSE